MLQAGQIFAGRYRVERRMAQGGMGAVYAAEHLSTEERVALKVLWPHVLGSKAAVESFQLEARVTARIGSDNIVRTLDAGFDEKLGLPYLAMELLRGLTLRALVSETGPLTPAETLAVLRQVAKALDKAHGHVDREGRPAPIVHRDLKPENIFVALRNEGPPIVKVLDFGIAKVLSESQQVSHDVKGTPLFMAREQFSHGAVTPQLDVWALGLIAFYLLVGRVYWLSGTQGPEGVAPLLYEVLVQPLPSPTERVSAFGVACPWPSGFDAWFLRCLERDPAARFASAGAATEALSEVFASAVSPDDIAAATPALADRVTRSLAASNDAIATAETVLPSTIVTQAGNGSALVHQDPPDDTTTPPSSITANGPPDATPQPQPRRAFARGPAIGAGVAFGIAVALGFIVAQRGSLNGKAGAASAGASASAAPLQSSAEAGLPEAPPSPSAPAVDNAASGPSDLPAPVVVPSARTPPAQVTVPERRPPRVPEKSTKKAEAAGPKPPVAPAEGSRPPDESQPPKPKPASSRNFYREP